MKGKPTDFPSSQHPLHPCSSSGREPEHLFLTELILDRTYSWNLTNNAIRKKKKRNTHATNTNLQMSYERTRVL